MCTIFQRRNVNATPGPLPYGDAVNSRRPMRTTEEFRMRTKLTWAVVALMTVALTACSGSAPSSTPAGSAGASTTPAGSTAPSEAGKKYTIYLSAVTIGNDWLQQMLRSAQVAVDKGPLAGRVELKVEQVDGSEQAQINSLNNIIGTKPDAIIVHANSSTALNPTIKRACDEGIVVISYSAVASEPCAYKINTNWDHVTHDLPVWLAEVLGGKGKIIVDRGLPGNPISELSNKEIDTVIATYPGIEIVGEYISNYALGDEQAGVTSLLAANPQIDGILTAGYGTGALQALKDANRPLVPIVMFAYNGSATACAQEPGLKCLIYTHPPYLSAEALKLAVEILDGATPPDTTIMRDYPRLTTDVLSSDKFSEGSTFEKLEIGKNVFPDLPPGLVLPASPDWIDITPQEAAGV
jgi:ribose transport system substrate-binding protein